MMHSSKLLLLLICGLMVTACSEDSNVPEIPSITFFGESIVVDEFDIQYAQVTFEFEDGNGDVGSLPRENDDCIDEPDFEMRNYNIINDERFLIESNTNATCIESITPPGQDKLLEGRIDLRASFPAEGVSVSGDSVIFTVQMRDRAGNLSNIIESSVFVVE